jgi:hypothetical protein
MSAPVAPSAVQHQCLGCRLDRGRRFWPQALGYGANHIVRRQRPPNPLQLELADWLDIEDAVG